MISVFLLFGAQVFFYPESKKHLSEIRERGAWPSSHGEEKASWEKSAIDLKQKAKTHSQASPLPPAHSHQTLSESRKSEDFNLIL